MCSLIYKPAGTELLLQRPNEAYRLAPYDGDYVAQGECSGFDEMFPSIDKCFYEGYPWRGTPIPDHGEVWSIPWAWDDQDGRLHLVTHGVRFPYRLEKWVSFADDATLRTDYRLTNLSGFDLDFMWAAHMMLNLEEGAELALPDGVRKIVTALSFDGSLGRYGDEFDWPVATLPDGRRRDLRRMQPKAARDVVKYFVKGRMPEGWCALTYPRQRLHAAAGLAGRAGTLSRRAAQRGRLAGPLQHLPGAGDRQLRPPGCCPRARRVLDGQGRCDVRVAPGDASGVATPRLSI